MQLCPGFHQAPLPVRQVTSQLLNRVDPKNRHVVLVIGMKVWLVMWRTRFGIHADDNAKESGELRQKACSR